MSVVKKKDSGFICYEELESKVSETRKGICKSLSIKCTISLFFIMLHVVNNNYYHLKITANYSMRHFESWLIREF